VQHRIPNLARHAQRARALCGKRAVQECRERALRFCACGACADRLALSPRCARNLPGGDLLAGRRAADRDISCVFKSLPGFANSVMLKVSRVPLLQYMAHFVCQQIAA
jgi:hypothetical protein